MGMNLNWVNEMIENRGIWQDEVNLMLELQTA